jgi:hypothetical protein
VQASLAGSASFQPGPTGLEICGFKIPGFEFSLNFRLQLPPLIFPPPLFFALALRCDLSNPIDVDFGPGGGRVAKPVPGLDEDFEAEG